MQGPLRLHFSPMITLRERRLLKQTPRARRRTSHLSVGEISACRGLATSCPSLLNHPRMHRSLPSITSKSSISFIILLIQPPVFFHTFHPRICSAIRIYNNQPASSTQSLNLHRTSAEDLWASLLFPDGEMKVKLVGGSIRVTLEEH